MNTSQSQLPSMKRPVTRGELVLYAFSPSPCRTNWYHRRSKLYVNGWLIHAGTLVYFPVPIHNVTPHRELWSCVSLSAPSGLFCPGPFFYEGGGLKDVFMKHAFCDAYKAGPPQSYHFRQRDHIISQLEPIHWGSGTCPMLDLVLWHYHHLYF